MAVAAVIDKNVFSTRLPDEATLFSAEALAFEHVKMSKYTHFAILSDSLSCSQSLHSMNIDHPHILDILYIYHYVSYQGKIVNFCWIHIHIPIGVHGNNEADKTPVRNYKRLKFLPQTVNILSNSINLSLAKLYSDQNKVNIPCNIKF